MSCTMCASQLRLAKFKSLAGWQLIVFSCKNQGTITHFIVISKTHIAVFLYELQYNVCLFASLLSLPVEFWNFAY